MKKDKKAEKYDTLLVPGILISLTVLGLIFGYFLIPGQSEIEDSFNQYEAHVAFVSENLDSMFSEELYEGAVERGKEYGVYVEQIGEDLGRELSIEEAMDMAIYEKVDGILLRPNGSEKLTELVQKANRYGIPVITIQKDIQESDRQGFVGSNDYFLGQEFGKRVQTVLGDEPAKVAVLFPEDSFDETGRSWFSQGLQNTVNRSDVAFDFQVIQTENGLSNAEKLIRSMMATEEERPDLILCLDEITTRSVWRLLGDDRGEKHPMIIGTDLSEDILGGILAGEIDSTITTDLQEMGSMGLDALMKYKQYHMVSYYTEVGSRTIDYEAAVEESARLSGEESR